MKYKGRSTASGRSNALQFDASLFRAHPEFAAGEVVAHVLGPGAMLVTVHAELVTVHAEHEPDRDEADPVLDAYLAFLEEQMRRHPQLIRPLTAADIGGLNTLLAGVIVDRHEELGDDFVLP